MKGGTKGKYNNLKTIRELIARFVELEQIKVIVSSSKALTDLCESEVGGYKSLVKI
jgi:hypothetical protein